MCTGIKDLNGIVCIVSTGLIDTTILFIERCQRFKHVRCKMPSVERMHNTLLINNSINMKHIWLTPCTHLHHIPAPFFLTFLSIWIRLSIHFVTLWRYLLAGLLSTTLTNWENNNMNLKTHLQKSNCFQIVWFSRYLNHYLSTWPILLFTVLSCINIASNKLIEIIMKYMYTE